MEEFLMPPSNNGVHKSIVHKGRNRDNEAMRLRALGWSLEDICERLNLGDDVTRAAAAIKRAMLVTARFAAEEHRIIELAGLDELEATIWRELKSHHVLVQHGRVIRDDDTGEPLEDSRFVLEAADRILKIKERRAQMLGTDAPKRTEIFSVDSIDAEIKRLEAEVQQSRQDQAPLPQELTSVSSTTRQISSSLPAKPG